MHLIKIAKILPFVLLLFVSSGEAKSNDHTSDLLRQLKGGGLHTIVLTNENTSMVGEYYYALLMMKDRLPNHSYDIHIYQAERQASLARVLHIKKYPALVLISNKKQVVTIQGDKKWDYIYNKLAAYVKRPSSKIR
ncbi:hypothetical protein EV207_10551 [Scopulibacillus darangshiensis]|uniref:Uncharacterized protein n=1 Tax=Scopulibacillus darangshiensis TaxID=442528 RepID=A0A4R2P6P0_9BACL|nr:hypothetical protein [Scopulibacillus darangshiensis]TCP30522.1 hypothetical protein EV207_10551 [Scopulibacillus darangshiensis]